jgi:hypothetical protein
MANEKRVIDWAAIRAEYEDGGKTLRQLASSHAVSKSAIIERRNKEQWEQPPRATKPTIDTHGVIHPDMNATARAYTALKLRFEKNMTWDEVAIGAGFASRGAARNAVKREMDRHITHDIKEIRDEELYRLEQMQARCYAAAIDKENSGWTWAVDRYAVLSKRKSELMNLDKHPDEDVLEQPYTKRILLTHQTSVEVEQK